MHLTALQPSPYVVQPVHFGRKEVHLSSLVEHRAQTTPQGGAFISAPL